MAGTNRRAAPPARRSSSRVAPAPKRKRKFFDYPRQGYRGLHRWLPSWRFMLGSFLSIGFLGLGALVAAYVNVTIPDPGSETSSQSSTVYFANADGSPGEVMGTFALQKRVLVDYATLPTYVGNAVVSAEDRTFWENSGVSLTGMARAFINNVSGGPRQGASTLTQQYVERYYVEKTTSDYVGKLNEALLAIKIARAESKEEILGRYLNTIYYGRDSYGIQVAAKSYFGVDAAALTLSQSAMLAGIIPSPNNWDPAQSPEKAEQKWNYVLDNMVEDGFITQAERDAQVFPIAEVVVYQRSNTMAGPNGYLLDHVVQELVDAGAWSNDEILRAGLNIYSTIQKPVQDMAVASVNGLLDGTLAGEAPNPAIKVAVVSIDPADGAVVAMYGGPDFITAEFDRATADAIQAGSTFKPFTLIAALESGISLSSTYDGRSPQQLPGWDKPTSNFKGTSFGTIDLVEATAQSVNTVYGQLNNIVGPDKTAEVATRAGITTTPESVPSNVLGSDSVHPIDMASAYATIAAQGTYSTPFFVRRVTYVRDGSVAYEAAPERHQVFDTDVMADTAYAMQQVVQNPKGSGAKWIKPLGRPIAGKTGTSTDNKSAWFVGFTPGISTAVALSQTGGESGNDPVKIDPFGKNVTEITGGTWPSALWASYMKQVFALPEYSAVEEFPARANVGGKATPTPTATATEEAPVETTAPVVDVAVPGSLAGKLEADASAAILNAGLQPKVQKESSSSVANGYVIRIEPGAGTTVAPGSGVTIVVSTGPEVQQTPVPEPSSVPSAQPSAPGKP